MPRQIPKAGDVFAVPLEDKSWAVGQVLDTKPILMNSFTCAFFDVRGKKESLWDAGQPLRHDYLISSQFVTREQFSRGNWPRLGNAKIELRKKDMPYTWFLWRKRPTIPRVVGSGIIETFLSAFYGLRAWAEMHDPSFYDTLLTEDQKRKRANQTPEPTAPSGRGSS